MYPSSIRYFADELSEGSSTASRTHPVNSLTDANPINTQTNEQTIGKRISLSPFKFLSQVRSVGGNSICTHTSILCARVVERQRAGARTAPPHRLRAPTVIFYANKHM